VEAATLAARKVEVSMCANIPLSYQSSDRLVL